MERAVVNLGAALRDARKGRNLSQAVVAKRAGLTQPHVSLIERGMDSHVSLVQRLAGAIGFRVVLEPSSPASIVRQPYGDDEIANRLYALGRFASKRITADNLVTFRKWLERAIARHGERPYLTAWLSASDAGPSEVATLLSDPTERGRYLRAGATMRPFVSQDERDTFFRPPGFSDAYPE